MGRSILVWTWLLVLVAPSGLALEVVRGDAAEGDAEKIDALLERGRAENFRKSGLDLMKASLDLCLACMEKTPDDYEILWRCARSAHDYAEAARNLQVAGWEEICKEWGKKGMETSGRAMDMENASDPWENLEILEMVQEALCLPWVGSGDLAIGVARTEMGEDVFHTMA